MVQTPQRLIVAMWGAVTVANGLLSLVPPSEPQVAMKQAVTSLCGMGLSFLVARLTASVQRRPATRALLFFAVLVFAAGTSLWIFDTTVQAWNGHIGLTFSDLAIRRYNWVFFNLLFGLQVTGLAFVGSARMLAMQQRKLLEAQLAALRFQINPHFLFNTLNVVLELVEEHDRKVAGAVVERLSQFMRSVLADDGRVLIPLARELETIEAYLGIEEVRLGDRLRVEYDVSIEAEEVLVPSLLLQPLVENSIRYAVAPSIDGAVVRIAADVVGGRLVMSVEDHRSGPQARVAPGSGVGLRNVAARLQAHFGSDGTVETRHRADGFGVILSLPAAPTVRSETR